jgi:hypothetical protein
MPRPHKTPKLSAIRSWAWFVLLWLCGFAGTGLLALPFRVLVALAVRK